MAGNLDETLKKAAECAANLDSLRTDSQFKEDEAERRLRLQQAMVEGIEALYYQNQVIIELLRSGKGQ